MKAALARRGGKAEAAPVTRAEYARMVERIEDLEELIHMREIEDKTDPKDYLPAALVKRLINGESPIRIWRVHRGLSLNALAKETEIPSSYLSEIENGKKPGSVAAHAAIAKVLRVTIDDLV